MQKMFHPRQQIEKSNCRRKKQIAERANNQSEIKKFGSPTAFVRMFGRIGSFEEEPTALVYKGIEAAERMLLPTLLD